jgi:putative RecB family exonuclease
MTGVTYRSVSQVNQMNRCGEAYRLTRIERAWQKPSAWLPQGSAVHYAAEMWEKSGRTMTLAEAQAAFDQSYTEEVRKYALVTPNFDYWERSGPYDGRTDIERRWGIGMSQVAAYIKYYEDHPEEVPTQTPDGPGIELEFDVKFGDIDVRGLIDMVVDWTPRDNKTGKKPGDDFQLASYAGALKVKYDVPFTKGDYWMAQQGKPTRPYDLTGWSIQRLADEYGEVDEKIRAEDFEPNPSTENCMFCSVRSSCTYAVA